MLMSADYSAETKEVTLTLRYFALLSGNVKMLLVLLQRPPASLSSLRPHAMVAMSVSSLQASDITSTGPALKPNLNYESEQL